MEILFTKHAEEKFAILRNHGVDVSKKDVLDVLSDPAAIDRSRLPLIISQGSLDETHVLRVVYRKEENRKIVITFYPGRKSHYEKKRN